MCKRSIVLLAVFGLLSWAGSSSFAQTICDDAIEIDGNDIIEGSTLYRRQRVQLWSLGFTRRLVYASR